MRRLPVFAWRAAVSVAGTLLIVGCAARAPRLRPTTAVELLDTLAARRAAVTSLRSRARLRSGLSGVWIREALLVRRPDAVRVDVLSPFGLALAVGVRGDLLWAYPPARGTRYEGPATPANMLRLLGAPVAVADIVDVLLGVPPARDPTAPPLLSATREGEYRLVLPLADGTQTIWFTGDTLLVRRAEETRGGGIVLRVAFEDYRDGFPHALEVSAEGRPSAHLTTTASRRTLRSTPGCSLRLPRRVSCRSTPFRRRSRRDHLLEVRDLRTSFFLEGGEARAVDASRSRSSRAASSVWSASRGAARASRRSRSCGSSRPRGGSSAAKCGSRDGISSAWTSARCGRCAGRGSAWSSGADDRPQPGLHGGESDRRSGTAPSPRFAPRGLGAGGGAARRGPAFRMRPAARSTTRISSRAECASG